MRQDMTRCNPGFYTHSIRSPQGCHEQEFLNQLMDERMVLDTLGWTCVDKKNGCHSIDSAYVYAHHFPLPASSPHS